MFGKYIFCAACLFGLTWAQTTPSLEDALNSLPPEFQGKIDEAQINELKNKTADLFKEQCMKNGGPNAYAEAETAFKAFPDCVKNLVDTTLLNQEIEVAKQNGTVDEVFKKYCDKKEMFQDCVRKMSDKSMPCFTEEERDNVDVIHNVTGQLAEFICYKDGDRIALFIAEKGPDCIQSNQERIETCLNKTIGNQYQFNGNFSMTSLPKISFEKTECNKLSQLQECVVEVLETCSAPTTANIVDSLFKFVRQATPCKAQVQPKQAPGSASGLAITSATVALGLVTLLLV